MSSCNNTSSSSKPIIAVCGATGAQGGSVARFLLEDGTFAVRALTRNPEAPKAKALADQGAHVVRVDFDDPTTLREAFEGVYGVFGHTNFWDPSSAPNGEGQIRHGKNQVDAAKAQGVKHFILSTAESTGAIAVPHWETQATINAYLAESGIPRTSLFTSWYYENVFGLAPLTRVSDTELKLVVPIPTDTRTPYMPVSDIGGLVLGILKKPAKYIGADVKVASEFLSPREFVAIVNGVLSSKGSPVRVMVPELDMDGFEGLRGQIWDELWLNMKYTITFGSAPPFRDPEACRELYPKFKTLRDIVSKDWEALIAAAR